LKSDMNENLVEPTREARNEPEVEIRHEPEEMISPSVSISQAHTEIQRPLPPQPASFKKWAIGLVAAAVIGFGFLGSWMAGIPKSLFNKPAAVAPEQQALKGELEKLRADIDLLKKDLQSMKDGQKKADEQLGKLQEEVKTAKEHQALSAKKSETPARKPTHQAVVYKVKKGDTLKSIARKFKVKPEDIQRWNHLPAKAQLKPDQKLTIYSSSEA
jgi:LysM repeat protein